VIALWLAWASAAELTVWHAYSGAEEAALVEAGRAYTEETGTAVRTVAIPFGAFDSKVETAIPRGNGPDLFIAAHGSLGKWRQMGLVQSVEVDLGQHCEVCGEAVSADGESWGYPLAYKSLLLLYDPAVISEPPETTDELISVAKGLTDGERFGLAYQVAEPYFYAPWLHAFGASAMDERIDGPAHVAALSFVQRLGVDEGIMPTQPTAELVGRLYGDGKAAMVISGPWFLGDLERPIAAAPLPVVSETGEPSRPYLTVEAAFVADQSSSPEEARSFAAFLSGPRGAVIRQQIGKQAVSETSVTSDDPLLAVMAEQASRAELLPTDPAVLSTWESQARALRRVMRGASSPELAARSAESYRQVLGRPPPPPTSPTPYIGAMVLVLLGALAWVVAPLREKALRDQIWKERVSYLWIAPAGLAMVAVVVAPFLTGAAVSLFAHHRGEWSFVGLAHFADIVFARDWPVTSPLSFFFTLAVTVLWTVTNVVAHVGLGVALALVLREPWIRMRPIFRAALILPWAIPNYITALIFKGLFHAQYGAVNAMLAAVVGGPVAIDWFGSFALAFTANLTTNTWLGFPFMMVVALGALQSIPRDLEEAAMVDGAGWWFRFRHVVWPLLAPALLPAVLLGSVWTFNMFNVVYLVSGGEPDGSTEILISEAYRWAFSRENRYGYAAAYAVLIFGVLFGWSRAANRIAGKRVL
jgi:arabinogalactan oligomer/maltooligosaccharide transport system permease protein